VHSQHGLSGLCGFLADALMADGAATAVAATRGVGCNDKICRGCSRFQLRTRRDAGQCWAALQDGISRGMLKVLHHWPYDEDNQPVKLFEAVLQHISFLEA